MIALWHSLMAEQLKLRRTLALWVAFIIPLAIVGLMFVGQLARRSGAGGASQWAEFSNLTLTLWSLLMLPLFVALEMALLSGLESADRQWKHLFALPIPRSALYGAKLIVGAALIGLSTLVLWAGIVAAGWGLRWLRPALGFGGAAPWLAILLMALRAYVAAWLMLALQLWVSMRWQSFIASIGLGMTATVLGSFLISAQFGPQWFPWTLPMVATNDIAGNAGHALLVGALGGLLAALAGCWDIVRRDVL